MNKKPLNETADKILNIRRCRYDLQGREILNPKPKLALVGIAKPLSDIEKMQRMTHADRMISEMEKYTETWEEHNDFSIKEDVNEEFFNTHFTLVDDEIPSNTKEPSEKAIKAANTFAEMADKIESGEIDPDSLNMDFLKETDPPVKDEVKPTE